MKPPKPNVVYVTSMEQGLNERALKGILCNPIYAGVPPFPALVSDEEWIGAARRLIKQDGAEQFLVNMLYVLRMSMLSIYPETDEGNQESRTDAVSDPS